MVEYPNPSSTDARRQNPRRRWIRKLLLLFLLLPAAGAVCLLMSGCGRDNGTRGPALESKLFSRVEIIGSRGVAPGQLNKPRSVACDREDNLYVADITGRIQKFSPDGRFLLQWQMPQ